MCECYHIVVGWRDDTSNCIQADPRSGILTVSAHEYYDNMDICWRISGNVSQLTLSIQSVFKFCKCSISYIFNDRLVIT